MKWFIKKVLSLLKNPLISIRLSLRGNKKFLLGARCKIRNLKYLKLGINFIVGYDARFLMIDEYHGVKCNPFITIGKNVFVGNRCSFLAGEKITIGDDCLIASDVFICSENHGINPHAKSYSENELIIKPVLIGEGCWIGEKVSILPGVTIGKKSIIGTGSVVTKDIPDYSIAVGNPAKIIKRYDFDQQKWVENKKI